MDNFIPQPQGLLRFLNALDTDLTSSHMNLLDEEVSFVSKFYTPQLQLSELAKKVLTNLKTDDIPVLEREFNDNTIIHKANNTLLKVQAPRMYMILQSIVLEAYAIVNCFVENPSSLKYLTEEDISITRENLNYVADYLGNYDDYNSVVLDLRDLDLCFSAIELQLPLIKKEANV